jgi:hypothetical protein
MAIPKPEDFKEVKYQIDDSYRNFIVVQPPSMPEDNPFDPYGQIAHILRRDWSKVSHTGKVSALIFDTFTEATEEINRFVGTAGRGNAGQGEVYGMDIVDPWGEHSMRTAQMNDYGKSQDLTIALLRMMMRSNQFPHVIVLGHRKEITKTTLVQVGNKMKEVTEVVGYDMGVPGRKWMGNMTKFAEQYLWQANHGKSLIDIRLHLRSDGKHHTKFRTTEPHVPADIKVPYSYKGQADVIRQVAKLTGVDMGSTDHGLRLMDYGLGGSGKTMLWTSLPEETFDIGPALYLPYDPSAARLASVWPALCEKR